MALELSKEAVVAPPAFEALVRAEQPYLLRIAWRFTRDAEEARDLVQAALADAYERRGALRDGQAAGPWLRRILVNRAINLHRRRKLWDAAQRLLRRDPAVASCGLELQLDQARRLEAVHRAVKKLPARQAAAFTLRYLEGLSVDEVADALAVDRGTVRAHLYRALQKLKLGAAAFDPAKRETP